MIFQSIKLFNFRGFYGETPTIKFTVTNDKSISLIHAMNGAGKTTLLNAITWALYDTTTFMVPDLINRQAVVECTNGEGVTCWVEIKFNNMEQGVNVDYYLKREIRNVINNNEINNHSSPSRLTLMQTLKTGESHPLNASDAQSLINRIIPPELSKYFFFEGN